VNRPASIRTTGISHVAVLADDLGPLVEFYGAHFGARMAAALPPEGRIARHCLVDVGGPSMLHLLEAPGVEIPDGPLFGRGRLDHLALAVPDEASLYALRDGLVASGASSGEVTDFGVALSVHFRDPAGMHSEITWLKPHDPTGAAPVEGAQPS
jgi:catechol 2,3-dioxygenase-like lactoylglutathione lyase family enzyme